MKTSHSSHLPQSGLSPLATQQFQPIGAFRGQLQNRPARRRSFSAAWSWRGAASAVSMAGGWRRLWIAALLLLPGSSPAQWVTQSFTLRPGWNAVFLHVDASHDTLANQVGADAANPILEVWLWGAGLSLAQYVQSPLNPTETGSQWASWNRLSSGSSVLQRLIGNAAYLVRVATNVSTYTWNVKGRPVAPKYQWTTTGLNFLGFPTVPIAPPSFESFLVQCPELQQNAEIYQYPGGEFGSNNPARVFAFRTTPVKRGQAFWIRSGNVFNRYFAPFELALSGSTGVDFRNTLSVANFRLRNLTANSLTVTLQLVTSEAPPPGQTNIAGLPPLLLRGALNTTNLTYGYAPLTSAQPQSLILAAKGQSGAEIEVVLGLNRAAMTNAVGALLAGVLRLTDSLGHAQVDVPVAATAGSTAGLWVGGAVLTQVGQYLKTYLRDGDDNLVTDPGGQYLVTGLNTNLGSVPRQFPLRLILHNPESGNAVLLQRVYFGLDAHTNAVVANQESVLNRNYLDQARRISATHLPWTRTNTGWAVDGRLGPTASLKTSIFVDSNEQASNPFLHTYHPDHDNLDTAFKYTLPQGSESYSVRREIRLNASPPGDDFGSLTAGSQTVGGDYAETITVSGLARAGGTNDTRQFEVRGVFTLNRVSEVPLLTRAP